MKKRIIVCLLLFPWSIGIALLSWSLTTKPLEHENSPAQEEPAKFNYQDRWRYHERTNPNLLRDSTRGDYGAGLDVTEDLVSFNPEQFRELIQDTLRELEPVIPYSEAAVELLMLTAAVESNLGEYIRQVRGPARGVFQCEPTTAHDIHTNWLIYNQEVLAKVNRFYNPNIPFEIHARGDLPMQIVMARLHYRRIKAPLPEIHYLPNTSVPTITHRSITDLARYWKKYYNTELGKGTVHKAIEKYRRYAL